MTKIRLSSLFSKSRAKISGSFFENPVNGRQYLWIGNGALRVNKPVLDEFSPGEGKFTETSFLTMYTDDR